MIAALFLGLVVGVVLGIVGGGGSIIAVPALVYGVGMSPAQAIPTPCWWWASPPWLP